MAKHMVIQIRAGSVERILADAEVEVVVVDWDTLALADHREKPDLPFGLVYEKDRVAISPPPSKKVWDDVWF